MRCHVAAGQGISLQRPSVYGLCDGAPVPFLEVRTVSCLAPPLLPRHALPSAGQMPFPIGSANAVFKVFFFLFSFFAFTFLMCTDKRAECGVDNCVLVCQHLN